MTAPNRLKGKVALITGAARGIGAGIALCLAEEGADIAINDLPPKTKFQQDTSTSEIEQKIRALGRKVKTYRADVANREQMETMYSDIVSDFGHIDIVVANAAFSIRKSVLRTSVEEFMKTVNVTQFGVFHTCQLASQLMVKQIEQGHPPGRIMIIGSVLATTPLVNSSAYNMSKAATTHFGRTLARELAQYRITVNVIHPGYTDTPGERLFATEDMIQDAHSSVPLGRLGTSRDIGRAAVYLASPDGDWITGTALLVDGGYLLGLLKPDVKLEDPPEPQSKL